MRRTIAAVATTTMLAGIGALAPAVSAHAADDTPGCVAQQEFNKAKKGYTKKRVVHIFGTSGKRTASSSGSGPRLDFYSYPTCSAYGTAQVGYRNGRLYAKSAQF